MLSVENLSKSFASQPLFSDVTFTIGQRERVGLVGRNGHGKTTLFRLIIGDDAPDSGTISIPKNYRIGYVRQELHFTKNSIIEEGSLGLPEDQRDHVWLVEKILMGLGYAREDMTRHPSEFSGGYQVRLNLAKVLVAEPDLLMLDEPTNYLDITSIRWLERYLQQWKGELLLITHDRSFMDSVITHALGIHRCRLRKIRGNTEKLYEQIMKEEEIYEKTRVNDEKRRKEVEIFISRFRAKARLANMVQSRIKLLEKQEKRGKLEHLKTLDFSFSYAPFPGKYMAEVKQLSFSYDRSAVPLIDNFSLSIKKDDRICIVGKNGKGKTTLLRLLANDLAATGGGISYNPNMQMAYFVQTNVQNLSPVRTVAEEIAVSHPACTAERARTIAGAMLFDGDMALKKIAVLSGGEKSRVMLGKMLVIPANLLLLDEPSNHLDIESNDSLLSALDNFEGAVIIVTHNEMFLHAIANRIIAFKDGAIMVHEGSYQSFLEKIGWDDEGADMDRNPSAHKAPDEQSDSPSRKDIRRLRSEIVQNRSRALKPLKEKIDAIESVILAHEKSLDEQNGLLIDASYKGDGATIASLSKSMHDLQALINADYDELDRITTLYETESQRFDQEIKSLDSD